MIKNNVFRKLVNLTLVLTLVSFGFLKSMAEEQSFQTMFSAVFHPGVYLQDGNSYEWDFDEDGLTDSTNIDAAHVFPGPGTYSVKLTVTDNEGITNSIIRKISFDNQNNLPPAPEDWLDANWTKRIKLTVNSIQVASDLTDVPLFLDLSILPVDFFVSVASSGQDIRITKLDGKTLLAKELVSIDKLAKTGELYFKAETLSSSIDNEFYIYYGNSDSNLSDENTSADVWSNGYAGVWHLNNTSQAVDSTSNAHHASYVGISAGDHVASKFGKSIYFDQVDNIIDFGSTEGLTPDDLTVTCWAKTTSSSGAPFILSWDGSPSDSRHWYMQLASENYHVNVFNQSGQNKNYRLQGITPLDGQWHQYSFTFSNDQLKPYWDASPDGLYKIFDNSVPSIRSGGTSDITAGGSYTGRQRFKGHIDEIRFASVVRSQEWLETQFNNQNDNNSFFTVGEISSL